MRIDEETQRLLKEVVDHYDQEDRAVRERQIRVWKKLKYLWDGFSRLWWSEVAHDWRVFDNDLDTESYGESAYYDKPINIYRAYLESIIAALSVTTPVVQCYPDDADNPLDLNTAKAGDYISKIVYKHLDAPLLWIHALYIYCTEGMIAAYNYSKSNKRYGEYDVDEYKDEIQVTQTPICPECGSELVEQQLLDNLENEYSPDDSDIFVQDKLKTKTFCPTCLSEMDPQFREDSFIVTRLVGKTTHPKSRQCIEVLGGLYVKVPNWARNQEDCPYLIYAYETHYANVLSRYGDLRSVLGKEGAKQLNENIRGGGMYDPYEQWGRLSPQYYGEYPVNNVTVRNAWLRPCAFEIIQDDSEREMLMKQFPNGAKVVLVNDHFADACNEDLDDHWTLTYNPLSEHIHFQPLGLLLVSVQEITNELISLILQTVEHGIPQTFADPSVLNFDQYQQTEVKPGAIFPAKPAAGKGMDDAFYEIKTANLSGEVLPFNQYIQEAGQMASGALPSLFGGAAPNSSKTASQYAMSRSQALQRLQNVWKMLTYWWKDIFGKVIPAYIKTVAEQGDEKYVEKTEDGNFVNVFVRKSELEGKIGSVELESAEELPMTWQQKRDVVMSLMQSNNMIIQQGMMSPENLPILSRALGLDDFKLPGENDRQKQYEEIRMLENSEPIPGEPLPNGQDQEEPPEEPSVQVDPLLDNHLIQAEICRQYLLSDKGRLLKQENPLGYKNILLHLQQHVMIAQVMQATAPQPTQPNEKPAMAQGPPNGEDDGQVIQ